MRWEVSEAVAEELRAEPQAVVLHLIRGRLEVDKRWILARSPVLDSDDD